MKPKKQKESDLIHIRVGTEIRSQIEQLIAIGLFSNQSEIAREAIRNLLLKYAEELKKHEKGKKKE